MAVRRRSESHVRGLTVRPTGYTPALSVTYSAAAAALAAFGSIHVLCCYLLPFYHTLRVHFASVEKRICHYRGGML